MSGPPPSSPASSEVPTPLWRRALDWLERAAWMCLILFVLHRIGPQLGALTGMASSGDEAPDLTAVTLDGDTLRPGDLRGRVAVINFWATWCLPCRLEIPSLERLHQEHRDDDLMVVGLATDIGREGPIRSFLAERQVTYPVGRATREHRLAFGGIPGIPTTFIVDRKGVVRHQVVGYFAPLALRAAVNRLLEEPIP